MRDIISSQAVFIDVPASTKKEVLNILATHAATLNGRDAHEVFDVLWERACA